MIPVIQEVVPRALSVKDFRKEYAVKTKGHCE